MRLYFGWYIIGITMISNMLIMGATFQSFGLFVIPVSQELGLSRADMNTAYVFVNIGNALFAPLIGRLADRISVKLIMSVCAALLGVGFVILGLSDSFWLSIFALAVLIPLGVDGGVVITLVVLEARWFRNYRTRAMAFSAIGLSLAGAVVPPLTQSLIEHFGWRIALIVLGLCLAAILQCFAVIIRERPGPEDHEPEAPMRSVRVSAENAGAESSLISVGGLMRMPKFWLLSIGASLGLSANVALSISLIPIAVGSGLSTMSATTIVQIVAFAGVGAKLLLGSFGDRFDRTYLVVLVIAFSLVVNAALPFVSGFAGLASCALLLGISVGSLIPLYQTLLADTFGVASFGTVRGLATPITAITNAIAIRYAGEVFDRTGSYDFLFGSLVVILAIAIAMILGLKLSASSGSG